MYKVKYWFDYYNERDEYQEFLVFAKTWLQARELMEEVKTLGAERVLVLDRDGKVVLDYGY